MPFDFFSDDPSVCSLIVSISCLKSYWRPLSLDPILEQSSRQAKSRQCLFTSSNCCSKPTIFLFKSVTLTAILEFILISCWDVLPASQLNDLIIVIVFRHILSKNMLPRVRRKNSLIARYLSFVRGEIRRRGVRKVITNLDLEDV